MITEMQSDQLDLDFSIVDKDRVFGNLQETGDQLQLLSDTKNSNVPMLLDESPVIKKKGQGPL